MITQIKTPNDRMMVEATFPNTPPDELFRYFIEPEKLTEWWPPEATTDPRMGGAYHLRWPSMDWDLRGHYKVFEPGHRLDFSWQWDHEPTIPTRHVSVHFEPLPGGDTLLQLTHSQYTEDEKDQEERQGHIDGWTHFVTRLMEVLTAGKG